ncbi:type II secretion system minor pseudopilin GspJ [Agaribacterium sp. ZY112]|uniref:type II secretion system minor pseudopilin GspJ n=1 Tax=Agaribacterium sp. ZY112 TaxID=3233574 RepID=UPI0035256D0B
MPIKQRGMTLIELLIAATMLASILVVVERSITAANRTAEISAKRVQNMRDMDRAWLLLETDLRNAIGKAHQGSFSGLMPAMRIDPSEERLLMFLRGGQRNPLFLPRTELLRVAYRVEDGTLWRDSWVNPYSEDEEQARPQQLLEGVEEFEVLALPRAPQGRSVAGGPWLDSWPEGDSAAASLPLALEITLRLEGERELKRLISLVSET